MAEIVLVRSRYGDCRDHADCGTSTAPAVRTCYDLLDIAPLCGVSDLTDGKYLDGQAGT